MWKLMLRPFPGYWWWMWQTLLTQLAESPFEREKFSKKPILDLWVWSCSCLRRWCLCCLHLCCHCHCWIRHCWHNWQSHLLKNFNKKAIHDLGPWVWSCIFFRCLCLCCLYLYCHCRYCLCCRCSIHCLAVSVVWSGSFRTHFLERWPVFVKSWFSNIMMNFLHSFARPQSINDFAKNQSKICSLNSSRY